ncbi:uncharacterized protein A4U43_C01F17860 [Asparagus officinalis]|uniref:Uncharacterized protein n=1 Tax=Asparagus officinalis TaxID=4686 RepID=A0A5P1FQT5_ASPOF|nr:uncharacterized protein A4U43_C01F17860 [Asparagus officinalis]
MLTWSFWTAKASEAPVMLMNVSRWRRHFKIAGVSSFFPLFKRENLRIANERGFQYEVLIKWNQHRGLRSKGERSGGDLHRLTEQMKQVRNSYIGVDLSMILPKNQEFELELDKKRNSFEEDLKEKLDDLEKKKIEISYREEQNLMGEQLLDGKMQKLQDKEKERCKF